MALTPIDVAPSGRGQTRDELGVYHSQLRLVDLFQVVRRSLKFMILCVIGAGFIGFGGSHLLPKRYTSTAYVRIDELGARAADAVMSSTPIIDGIIAKLDIPGDTIDARRRYLIKNRRVTVAANETPRTSKLFRFEVTDTDRHLAQAINQILLSAWLDSTRPTPRKRAAIEAEIERQEAQAKSVTQLLDRLGKESPTLVLQNSLQAELATPLAALATKRDQNIAAIVELREQLIGVSGDVVFGPPNLPEEPSYPDRGYITVLSALCAGILSLLIVLGNTLWPSFRFSDAPIETSGVPESGS